MFHNATNDPTYVKQALPDVNSGHTRCWSVTVGTCKLDSCRHLSLTSMLQILNTILWIT